MVSGREHALSELSGLVAVQHDRHRRAARELKIERAGETVRATLAELAAAHQALGSVIA